MGDEHSSVGSALQDVAEAEFDFAAAQLAAYETDPELAIHQCRKSLKRLRALVRIGIAVPGAKTRPLNRALRDVARVLAPLRDATESRKTLDQLIAVHPELEPIRQLDVYAAHDPDVGKSVRQAAAGLQEARELLPALFTPPESWRFVAVATGIEATFVRASVELFHFTTRHRDEIGHTWRKEIQCLSNQLNLIRPLCPEFLAELLGSLSQLSDHLGRHNDLAVLRVRMKTWKQRPAKPVWSALRNAVRADQRQLRAAAIAVGSDFFAMAPDRFRALLLSECGAALTEPNVLRPTS